MFYGRVVARWLTRRQDQIIAITKPRPMISPNTLTKRKRDGDPQWGGSGTLFARALGVARAVVAQRFGLHQPYFLYVSRLEHPGKNHLGLIRAFNEF
jgi:hypothetical protein